MKKLGLLILIFHTVQSQDPVIPSFYNYSTLGVLAANGSSATGGCSDAIPNLDSYSICATPTSSVLFDGVIPTLTALDGNTWARQLLVLGHPIVGSGAFNLNFNFENTEVGQVEVVIFNCPEWNTVVRKINVKVPRRSYYGLRYETVAFAYPTVLSCDSLVKVCIPLDINSSEITLSFLPSYNYIFHSSCYESITTSFIYIAEVTFYSTLSHCPPFTTIPGNWSFKQTAVHASIDTKSESKKDPSIIMSAISMVTALQTTIIVFLVVVGVVCKYNKRKTTPRCPDITEMGDQLYETVDPQGSCVQVNGKEGMEIKKNNSYAVRALQ